MATNLKNLSDYKKTAIKDIEYLNIAIVVAQWNTSITDALYEAAHKTLIDNGIKENNISKYEVPGTFELTYGAAFLFNRRRFDAIIVLGCVIKGETPHFDYICQGVANGITQINSQGTTPVIFGVLTTNSLEQAQDRAGGKHGNKGVEAADSALKMIGFVKQL